MKKTGLPIAWVSALFKKFQARYGHKFQSSIDGIEELAIKEWAEGLSGISGEQLKRGIDTWNGDWPPSLCEFRNCCVNKSDLHTSAAYTEYSNRKLLPNLKASKEKANKHRAKLRELGIIKTNNSDK